MRQDVYRVAYDEAISELSDILNKFEQLRQRKERVEKVVEVLKPLLGANAPGNSADPNAAGPSPGAPSSAPDPPPHIDEPDSVVPVAVMQMAEDTIAYPAPQASENASDPFQRRINNALRQGFGSGETREYARAFAGGILRGR